MVQTRGIKGATKITLSPGATLPQLRYALAQTPADRTQMKLIIGIAALLVAVLVFLRMRSRKPVRVDEGKADPAANARLKDDFHAVSIRPGIFACKAARDLEGQRFLSGSAPRIPLSGCDASDCTCRFSHHADRRAGEDRRSLYRSSIGIDIHALGVEKRSDNERRREDRESD
jgi:hypothetical protein